VFGKLLLANDIQLVSFPIAKNCSLVEESRMPKDAKPVPVYAQVKVVSKNVVSAAHPTQARNPNYRPPFLVAKKGDVVAKDGKHSLLVVGHATYEADGSTRVVLTAVPPSNVLIVPKAASR
jgi:hypothetical protein